MTLVVQHARRMTAHKRIALGHEQGLVEPRLDLFDHQADALGVDGLVPELAALVKARLAVDGHVPVEARCHDVGNHVALAAGRNEDFDAALAHGVDRRPSRIRNAVRGKAQKRAVDIKERRLDHVSLLAAPEMARNDHAQYRAGGARYGRRAGVRNLCAGGVAQAPRREPSYTMVRNEEPHADEKSAHGILRKLPDRL